MNPNWTDSPARTEELRSAIENEEFELHYQPQVQVETRELVGLEALVRWRSPRLGLVSPAQFIPLLERTGLILELGRWTFGKAVLDQALWRAAGLEAPRIAINVSAVQLRHAGFVAEVVRALDGSSMVDIEITESRIMEDVEATIGKLRNLKARGVRIAIDDFGTGYSSLAYLARLPVQTLKIDRVFIANMLRNDEMMAVVHTIISLAQSLKLSTIAEGVETEEQADMLALLCCDSMQGYLVCKPVPEGEIRAVLKPAGGADT